MIKSESYYTRKKLMRTLEIPTMSKTRSSLRISLAQVFFDQCPEALAQEIGLTPPLEGPGEILWTSPSDLLLGKVVLKPPLTDKHIKALTHQGILELGGEVENHFLQDMEEEKELALKAQERRLQAEAERKVQQAIVATKREEQLMFEEKTSDLREQFERELADKLDELQMRLVTEFQQLFDTEKDRMEEMWQAKMEEAVEEIVTSMTKKCVEEIATKEKELSEQYEKQIIHQKIKSYITLREEESRCKDTLQTLQHNLECKNIANMMYVICVERRKCESERNILHKEYQEQIMIAEKYSNELKDTITNLQVENADLLLKLDVRETLLCEVLKQFQKFINFALRAHPTQAEFLLDVEKLLTYELTRALVAVDDQEKIGNNEPCEEELSLLDTSEKTSMKSVTIVDYHDCINLVTPQQSDSEVSEAELLPAMFYKEGMYIREDFRNMLTHGMTISPENLVWNKDVEHLLQIFNKMSQPSISKDRSSVHFGQEKECCSSSVPKRKVKSIISNLKTNEESLSELEIERVQYGTEDSLGLLVAKDSLTKHRASLLSATKVSTSNNKPVVISLSKTSGKEKNSQEMQQQIEKEIVVSDLDDKLKSDSKLLVVRDSIILNRLSMKQEEIIPVYSKEEAEVEVEQVVRRNSRLSLARDSIEIRKMSLGYDEQAPNLQKIKNLEENLSIPSETRSYVDNLLSETELNTTNSKSKSLTMHQDSLEIIREHRNSKSSEASPPVKKEIEPVTVPVILKPAHNNKRASIVSFIPLPKVYETDTYNYSDSPWKMYPADNVGMVEKPAEAKLGMTVFPKNKIVGDINATEHLQHTNEFASTRVNSLLNILRESPDLIKLFTGCSQ